MTQADRILDTILPINGGTPLAARLSLWRQQLHAQPELRQAEAQTAAFVATRLAELGVQVATGVGGHGVVGTIKREGSSRAVGLRVGMDAVQIQEQNEDLSYRSCIPNVMHAKGHDGHMAALLGAAAVLQEDRTWSGTVHFVFQPAEEGGGGALAMKKAGLCDRFPMEHIFGWHNWPGLPMGTIAVHDCAVMAAGAGFEIVFEGKMGHAGVPHEARDPILALGQCIVALQTIVARSLSSFDSAVVSVTKAEAFQSWNVIPKSAHLKGTMRYLSDEAGRILDEAIHAVANGIGGSLGLVPTVNIWHGIPVTNNHPSSRDVAAAAAGAVAEVRRDIRPSMAGEDFAWILQGIPGAFVWIGSGPIEKGREMYTPRYDFNDAILPLASRYLAEVATRALS